MNPVKINDTTYEVTLPGGDKVEVGDRDALDFKPCAKLKRWGEECSLVLSIPTAEKILPTVQDDKILWQGEDYGAEFYQATDGFKFNIILPEKPATNVFPLDFGSENLDFYYQTPLTEEFQAGWSDEFQCEIAVTETDVTRVSDGQVLVHRPEDVVGSYAVYHATKGNVHAGQAEAEKYKTGKAFHWYRPLIWDNAGKQCWGILSADPQSGIRTVTVPQEFLDNAVYPVTIDDTFGYTTEGGSYSTAFPNRIYGYRFTGAAGTATSVSIYGYDSGENFKGILVKQSDQTIITNGIGDAKAFDASAAWKTSTFGTSPTIEAIDYFISVICDNYINYYYDSGVTNYQIIDTSNSYSSPTDPTDAGFSDRKMSIYCTYTPGGGGEEKTSSDTGAGADSLPARDIALPEAGSGVDALVSLQTPAAKTASDTGYGVDACVSLQITVAKTSSDAGSGVEAVPVPGAVLAGSESGSGIEAFIARLLAAAETVSGAEASEIGGGGLLKNLFASELGEGADGLTAKIEKPTKGGGMRLWT